MAGECFVGQPYVRNCKFCLKAIRMAQAPHGGYLPWELDGSGVHFCTSTSSSAAKRSVSARSTVLGSPSTLKIICWWCPDWVYFHTNGNGDCVLFDEPLGPPWQVHGCWEERHHHPETKGRVAAMTAPSVQKLATPSSGLKRVRVVGAVRSILSQDGVHKRWSAGGTPWRAVELRQDDTDYVISLPESLQLQYGDLLAVTGTWLLWHSSPDQPCWLFVARSCEGLWRDGAAVGGPRVFINSLRRGHCDTCGLQLRDVSDWHVTTDGDFECRACETVKNLGTSEALRPLARALRNALDKEGVGGLQRRLELFASENSGR